VLDFFLLWFYGVFLLLLIPSFVLFCHARDFVSEAFANYKAKVVSRSVIIIIIPDGATRPEK
jgi:hypothetical protein